ncbi:MULTISPECIES: Calx-beta domain-containing protein [Paenibacillus]|uniref:Calx-beta domain-containing protein n=1 Tax=Paenibacillus TaxID=44249 RepID=UPI0022B8DB9E|nr:Calx-beta domain-containing protein [Paenibacillus caseinilyticus]MCZ8518233.1 glycosyl hydrolase family 28-related protein [Paenibacillus caseinilyticus]
MNKKNTIHAAVPRFLIVLLLFLSGNGLMLNSAAAAPTGAPIIIHASEAVKPGYTLTLYGEYFDSTTQVRMNESTVCPIEYVDPQGHYVTCKVPSTLSPGVWSVKASNSFNTVSWSSPVNINAPAPLWISQNKLWAGQPIRLIGRNFVTSEFGGSGLTKVRLVNGTTFIKPSILSFGNYQIVFTVPVNTPPAVYQVEVSHDGEQWSRLPDQTLEVIEGTNEANDPLNLGLWWAQEFNWSQKYNALTDFSGMTQIDNNGNTDVVSALQQRMCKIALDGGGQLYLPYGTYRLNSTLNIPSGVTLIGQTPNETESTKLVYGGSGGGVMISNHKKPDGTTAGRIGIARISISVLPNTKNPDIFIQFGDHNQVLNSTKTRTTYSNERVARDIFVKEVVLNASIDDQDLKTPGNRGIGVIIGAKENVAIQNNSLKGNNGTVQSSYISEYLDMSDNTFEYSNDSTTAYAKYSVIRNNTLTGHPTHVNHGLYVKTYALAEKNTIQNMGSPLAWNDGEAILGEVFRGGTKMQGSVESADGKTLNVAVADKTDSVEDWDLDNHVWDQWHVAIVDGKGMGQLNEVKSIQKGAPHSSIPGHVTGILTVKDDWKVLPDHTSRFVVILPLKYLTFVGNTANHTAKGFWFYGDTYRGIMQKNSTTDSEGIMVNTVYAPTDKEPRFDLSFFDRLEWNTVTGVSPYSKVGSIGLRYDRNGYSQSSINGNLAYGTDIKDNKIYGVKPKACETPAKDYSEAPNVSGLYAFRYGGKAFERNTVGEAVHIERNAVQNSPAGLTYDNYTRGLIAADNALNSVDTKVNANSPTVEFYQTESSGDESSGTVSLAVYLSSPSSQPVTVDYEVCGGTATRGTDYQLAAGTLTLRDGSPQNIPLTVLADTMADPGETIIVTLSRPVNAIMGYKTTHTYTIR